MELWRHLVLLPYILCSIIIYFFPAIIRNKLLGDSVKINNNTTDDGNSLEICQLPTINGSKTENGEYNITVMSTNKRRKFIGIREWKSPYDFVGHGIAHLSSAREGTHISFRVPSLLLIWNIILCYHRIR